MSSNIKVSILCLAYNQEKFIKQTLDSFLMQKTDFNFEVLINDDASTDGTSEIIKEYQNKYPEIIKPTFHKKNQYSQGKRNFMLRYLIPKAKGQYLAVCEGDDFWTDSNKLQKQANFLDKHPGHAICFHPVKVVYEDGSKEDSVYPTDRDGRKFTVGELLKRNFIQTNSVMYRKQTYKKNNIEVMPGDWYLHLYHAQFGKIGYIDDLMSVYRRHPGGIWWKTTQTNIDEIWIKYGISHMSLYIELIKIYGNNPKYMDIITGHISGTVSALSRVDDSHKTRLIYSLAEKYKDESRHLITALARSIYNNDRNQININEELVELKSENLLLKNELKLIEHKHQDEINTIINSKVYRLGYITTEPYRIIRRIINGAGK